MYLVLVVIRLELLQFCWSGPGGCEQWGPAAEEDVLMVLCAFPVCDVRDICILCFQIHRADYKNRSETYGGEEVRWGREDQGRLMMGSGVSGSAESSEGMLAMFGFYFEKWISEEAASCR